MSKETDFAAELVREKNAIIRSLVDAGDGILLAFAELGEGVWTPEKREAYEALSAVIARARGETA